MTLAGITDQGAAERFVHDYGQEVCYLPAFDCWRRVDPETKAWREAGAAEILHLIARCGRAHADAATWGKSAEERNFWLHSLSWPGLWAVYSRLKHFPPLAVEPDQFDRYHRGLGLPGSWILAEHLSKRRYQQEDEPVPREYLQPSEMFFRSMATDNPWEFRTGATYDLIRSELTQNTDGMDAFLCSALAVEPLGVPRMLARGEYRYGALDPLYAVLRRTWGNYVDVIPASVWLNPHRLSHAWVRRIHGVRLLFLDGAKGDWQRQGDALQFWLRGERLSYLGADDLRRDLILPGYFVLLGTGTKPGMLDPGLADLIWFLPPIAARAGRPRL